MATSFRYAAGLAVLASLANATVSSRLPRATMTFNFPLDQFAPRPTKAPVYGDLRKRQSTSDVTVLVAPDNTCGYVSGRAGAEYTCGGSATCALMPPVNSNVPGRVACCNTQNCNAPRTCFDYKDIYTSSLCDSGCRVDTDTRKCTETGQPYCRTVSFSDDIYGYWCASEENSTPQAVLTTYAGQRARQWSELVVTLGDTTSSRATRPTGPTATSASARGSSTSPAPVPDPEDETSSTPIGAIVGGVVGGVAVIALALFGIWFFIRKKNHNGGPQGQQQQQQPQQPQGSPSQYAATTHTQSFHDPKFGGPNGYPQSFGGTPPPPPQDGYQHQQPYFAGNAVPDRTDTTSPGAVSQMTYSNTNNDMNNRYSMQAASPQTTQGGFQQFGQAPPAQQQQQQQPPPPTIHEAPTTVDGHRGHMHELA
ncbi:hypothetical protein CGRA01v4_00949 [Colletotrichum graminicola]|uniref:Uncharacterized protein n=1 Tax=Colletotrichum graminicola (strain M1.001 / M2 / FGSC 10212) TaxID=645133 RepID=E3QGZ5_COLGM|nr:uncharacterized protein GLRG_05277 [Colletotrichum graminicola M1.001]EFQ30133.1 hypothetical protein GLRG_05277 [Colletotrichum graminicola M1.001]WDK09671.1 hypothetical protein CGRA01v4_00949 [Colletotrichum graminicola]